ncbi:MAG: short-chain dehydrogenase [Bacteroidetes bacterium B1(2017)]|nr:MAG: short-chain dehydrogenase [Bacteroidetes bacterium B1(2017)]
MNIDLRGKNALVCGSTKGIGFAIAKQFALLGANVTMMARNGALLERVVRDLHAEEGQKHDFLVADFSKPEQVKAAIEQKIQAHYSYQILVNNSGGPSPGPAMGAKEEEFLNAFNSHLLSSHHLVQGVVNGMKQSGYGRIINIISTSVKIPLKGLGVSNTIRGAVASWSKTMANELAPLGITVNNILPGATGTDRLTQIIEGKALKQNESIDDVSKEMLAEIPMNRFAKPDEIAYAACFLASEYAAYITGINVPVDGGRTGCL